MVSLDDGAGYVRVERALQRQTGKGLVMTDLKSQSQSHMEAALKAPYIADGTHPVPVSNFLNAQCTCQ